MSLFSPKSPPLVLAALLMTGCSLDTEGQVGATADAGDAGLGSTGSDASHDGGAEAAPPQDATRGEDTPHVGPPDGDVEDVPIRDAPAGDTSPPPPPSYPSDCGQADAGTGTTTVTLYVDNDPAKPWSAVCQGGNTYLHVPSSGNVSSYPAGGCASVPSGSPAAVTTTWSMIRVDPATLLVDTADYTGASSTGTTHEVSGGGSYVYDYTQMPYASTRSCDDVSPMTATGTVDLTGTSFAVAFAQAWPLQGFSNNGGPFGGAMLGASNTTVSLSVGGFPAGISPCNDYYTTKGGTCLQLVYSP